MAWVRIDDGYVQHPKMLAAGADGIALDIAAMCYCARQQTDGFVPAAMVPCLLPIKKHAATVRRLIELGRWVHDENRDGYIVHDYLQYNPTAAEIAEMRAAKSAAGKAGARSRWRSTSNGNAVTAVMAGAMSTGDSEHHGEQHGHPLPIPIGRKIPTNGAPPPQAAPLVEYYIAQAEQAGWHPTERIRGHIGREIKRLLGADRVPENDVRAVLRVMAKEHKSPGSIDLVLADFQAGRGGA